jgi:hypothetical protein
LSELTLDHSTVLDEAAPGMDGDHDRQRAETEPRGFLPRSGAGAPPWRRVMDWLFGDRSDIDQEGLLARRTLLLTPRRPPRDEPIGDSGALDKPGDESA